MKRTVFLALALFALMAVGVYAQTEADFGVRKTADGRAIEIINYVGKATTVNIPARIQNLPVTLIIIGPNQNITSVTIPSGIARIEDSAFQDCPKLTSVTIPDTVTSIGGGAFSGCTSLRSITISASVKEIGQNAFRNCTSLTNVTIGNGVTFIGLQAFGGCTSLTSVAFGGTIPSSGFDANAFRNLGDIRDKYLAAGGGAGTYTRPNGTSTAWTKGASATSAPAAAGTPGLKFKLKSDGKGYIVVNPGLLSSSVVIPATYNNLPVTTIESLAFKDCALIPSVTIPASVTLIEQSAFSNCVSLNSVTFEGANTTFGATDFPNGMDLMAKYKAGGAGTYTLSGKTWTKK